MNSGDVRTRPTSAASTAKTTSAAASSPTVAKPRGRTAPANGSDTRARIVSAAKEVLRDEGITQASARTIARRGDFNQALIFYHFGSLEALLVEVAKEEGQQRADLYSEQFQRIAQLADLVRIARDVHHRELRTGGPTVLSQLLAGAHSSETIATGMLNAMQPWMQLVEAAMGQTVARTPMASLLPQEELAFGVASLFIGMELLSSLDPDSKRAESLFDVFGNLAAIADALIANPNLVKQFFDR
jgi:AcrR family transcriptional regulator